MSMINHSLQTGAFSMGQFVWAIGVVEDRNDPEKLGRLRVRVYGYHTDEKDKIKTEDLFWAPVISPIQSSSFGGIGLSPTGIVEGSTVIGFFLDGHNRPKFLCFGYYLR